MRNLTGKFVLLGVVFITSCSPCDNLNVSDYKHNLSTIERVKDIVINENFLNQETKYLDNSFIKQKTENKDYKILDELYFKSISKIKEVIVFRFQYDDESNFFEKKVDNTFDMPSKIKCSYYLFYHPNKETRHNIAYYEQYAECSKEFEDVDNWSLVKIRFPCSD
ncbi:hypothetical protein [Bizionia paragorgiae]|uniref:Lipoprotein n=1 Tax=Bizionia paragorgiae TaxID=283786 RepID=A0A1H4DGA7_BIZPA|nr:hypothetical protein [Bizionia paragorgiae]SEA71627.1 hypothetical protein SAMN04487990_1319 [Bizionia paragorgiae]